MTDFTPKHIASPPVAPSGKPWRRLNPLGQGPGAGARTAMPLENQFWGDRAGSVVDPAGYVWWIATHQEDLTPEEVQQRAADFFKQQMPQHA